MPKKKPRRRPATSECPNCGDEFPAGRPACPHCGSDSDTGWSPGDEVEYRSLDVPDTFDDAAYRETIDDIQAQAGPRVAGARGRSRARWTSRQVRVLVVGALLLAAMIVPALIAFARMKL